MPFQDIKILSTKCNIYLIANLGIIKNDGSRNHSRTHNTRTYSPYITFTYRPLTYTLHLGQDILSSHYTCTLITKKRIR